MKRIIILMIVTVIFSLSCDKETTKNNEILTIEDLLVKNNEITGWSYSGGSWVANNISDLTTYIDGLAEIFQRHGFVEAAHQQYQGKIDGANRQLLLYIYNQGIEENAKALYQDPDLGLSGAVDWTQGNPGKEAHYIRYGGLSQVLSFYQDKYYVQIQINYDTEESLNVLKQFALNVSGKM